MVMGIHILEDKDIENATKSLCDGGNLWLKVKKSKKDGRLWKSWAYIYASPKEIGKRREAGLGGFPAVTKEVAREKAAQADAWFHGSPKKDPIVEFRAENKRGAQTACVTVSDVIEGYIEKVLPHYQDQGWIRTQLKRIGKGVGPLAPKDVTAEMLCEDVGYRKLYLEQYPTSTKLLIVMRSIFGRAKALDLCPTNVAAKGGDLYYLRGRRPKKHKVVSHPSVLREDMYDFIKAVQGHQDGRSKKPSRMTSTYACEMIALTGVRVSEVIEATWGEIDRKGKRWTVNWRHIKMKDDEVDRPIPITTSMDKILEEMERRCGDKIGDDDPVFRGPTAKRGHLYTVAAIGDIAERVGWPQKIDNHGFRTTLTGWGENHGKPHLVEVQLHHKKRGTIGHYSAQNDDWPGRSAMMQDYDDYCHTPRPEGEPSVQISEEVTEEVTEEVIS